MEFDVGKVYFQMFKKDREYTYQVKGINQEVHISSGSNPPSLLATFSYNKEIFLAFH